jgi:hypothetical protein
MAASTLADDTERLLEVALIATSKPSILEDEFEMYLLEV